MNLPSCSAALPALLAASLAAPALASPRCEAHARGPAPTVVELYTSEGCSSCPPAEAWLNTLTGRPDVLALAFHVTYWDYLGWTDRLASPEGTERQRALARSDGQRGVYTPQVRVSGQDWRRWPQLPSAAAGPTPSLHISRDGDTYTARVAAWPQALERSLAGYWVVLEDGHRTQVRAGENSGSTLRHDHVVRAYRPVPAWLPAVDQQSRLTLPNVVSAHPRRVAFVVVGADGRRPLQAAVLGC